MGTRVALGKGLASLIPSAGAVNASSVSNTSNQENSNTNNSNKDKIPGITFCNINDIDANEFQPRQLWNDNTISELSQSIKENGIIQPLIVRKTDAGYQLIAGERRLRAAKQAGLTSVPIVVRRTTDKEALELALIENIQRENLNCIDEAFAYYHLVEDFNLTQEEVAKRVGKERATVANYLRLVKLPGEVVDALKEEKISFGHAKAILGLESINDQIELLKEIIANELSVRQTEAAASNLKNAQEADVQPPKKKPALSDVMGYVKKIVESTLQSKVKLSGNEQKGKITIEYYSKEELDRIVCLIKNAS